MCSCRGAPEEPEDDDDCPPVVLLWAHAVRQPCNRQSCTSGVSPGRGCGAQGGRETWALAQTLACATWDLAQALSPAWVVRIMCRLWRCCRPRKSFRNHCKEPVAAVEILARRTTHRQAPSGQ